MLHINPYINSFYQFSSLLAINMKSYTLFIWYLNLLYKYINMSSNGIILIYTSHLVRTPVLFNIRKAVANI